MGDEVKLSCSESRSHNYSSELKDVFLNRFKLSDDFWRELFDNSCPEGLGETNEKLRNGEDLSCSEFIEFKLIENTCIQEDNGCHNSESDISRPSFVEYKTPLLVKSLSNACPSPSLFSPSATTDFNVQKGPNSSTPLPWKSVFSTSGAEPCTTTPTSARCNAAYGIKTPVADILDQTIPNTKPAMLKLSRSLSATLDLDPVDHMNLSWTSSLATPPEQCEKPTRSSDRQGASSIDISKILAEERDVSAGRTKGVARVLFTSGSQGIKSNPRESETSVNTTTNLETSALMNVTLSFNMRSKGETVEGLTILENYTDEHLTAEKGMVCLHEVGTCGNEKCHDVNGNTTALNTSDESDADKVAKTGILKKISFSSECNESSGELKECWESAGPKEAKNCPENRVTADPTLSCRSGHNAADVDVEYVENTSAIACACTDRRGALESNTGRKASGRTLYSCTDKLGDFNGYIIKEITSCTRLSCSIERAESHKESPTEATRNPTTACYGVQNATRNDTENEVAQNRRSPCTVDHKASQDDTKYESHENTICSRGGQQKVHKRDNEGWVSELSVETENVNDLQKKAVGGGCENVNLTLGILEANNAVKFNNHDAPLSFSMKKNNITGNKEQKQDCFERKKCSLSTIALDLPSEKRDNTVHAGISHVETNYPEETKESVNNMFDMDTLSELPCFDFEFLDGMAHSVIPVEVWNANLEQRISNCTCKENTRCLKHRTFCNLSARANGVVREWRSGVPDSETKNRARTKSKGVSYKGEKQNDLNRVNRFENKRIDAGLITTISDRTSAENSGDENKHESNTAFIERGEELGRSNLVKNVETASQVLQDLSLQQLGDITFDTGYTFNLHVPGTNVHEERFTTSLNSFTSANEEKTGEREQRNDHGSLTESEHGPRVSTEASKNERISKQVNGAENCQVKSLCCNSSVVPLTSSYPSSPSGGRVVRAHDFSFLTASGKKETVSEKSLDKARKILNDMDMDEKTHDVVQGTQTGVGLFTASGRKVEDSNEFIKKTCFILNRVDKEDENACNDGMNKRPDGFSTKFELHNMVSEPSLEPPQTISNDEKCQGSRQVDEETGLSFSSGVNVAVSEESHKKARKKLNGVNIEENSRERRKWDEKDKCSFSSGSEKKVTVSEVLVRTAKSTSNFDKKRLNRNRNVAGMDPEANLGLAAISSVFKQPEMPTRSNLNDIDNDHVKRVIEQPNLGFLTASGKKVAVSEESLRKANKILKCVDQNENCESGRQLDRKEEFRFSTASGKRVTVSEESLKKAQRILNDVNKEENCQPERQPNSVANMGLSTASGKRVSVSEVSVKSAQKTLNDKDENCLSVRQREDKANVGFSTASGKRVNVSKESLTKAQKILNDVDKDENCLSVRQLNEKAYVRFSIASGKGVTVSEDSLKKTQKTLNDVDKDDNCQYLKQPTDKARLGFSTASGKKITVSEESLKKALKIVNEVDQNEIVDDGRQLNRKAKFGFSAASGKRVTVSEETLKRVQKNLNDVHKEESCQSERQPKCVVSTEFSTSSGKSVVSDESPKKAQEIMSDVDKDENCLYVGQPDGKANMGFSKDYGKKVTISEESLKKAEKIVNEVDQKNNCKDGIELNRNAKFGFSTASGRRVTVSEESLKKAQMILNDGIKKENNLCVRQPNDKTSMGFYDKTNMGFSTASGKRINISDESLRKARKILNDVDSEKNFQHARRLNDKANMGFFTAFGKKVIVTEESLKKAQRILNDVSEDKNCQGVRQPKDEVKFGFCSASGTKAALSEESLKEAKKILHGVNEQENFQFVSQPNDEAHLGSRTLSGKKDTSETTLKEAKQMFDDTVEYSGKVYKASRNDISTFFGKNDAVYENLIEDPRNILNTIEKKDDDRRVTKTTHERYGLLPAAGKIVVLSEESIREAGKIVMELEESSTRNCDQEKGRTEAVFGDSILPEKKFKTFKEWFQEEDKSEKKKSKRLSSESKAENDRPCKVFRRESDVANQVDPHKQEQSRSWMKPYNSDPLEVYNDRKYSKFRSPFKAVVVSPESELKQKLRVRNGCAEVSEKCFTPSHRKSNTDINDDHQVYESFRPTIVSRRKSNSHFVTPYRTSESNEMLKRERSAQIFQPQSNKDETANKKSKLIGSENGDAKYQKDKICSVKPLTGSIYKLRNSPSFNRISLADYVRNESKNWSSFELFKLGIPAAVLSITSRNAESYRFKGSDFLSGNACHNNTGVRFTDGAVLFLGEDKCVGVQEFARAFLSSPGVDSSLIDEQWIANHYRWIVWKLVSYEVTYPRVFFGRSLTPDMVLRQLKYRYDREIDRCERSAIKKILERDDTPSRGMVLCVSAMDVPETEFEAKNGNKKNCHNAIIQKNNQMVVMMTDGWYCIRVLLDDYLQRLAKEKKIFTGQKLYIQGAELVGSDQPVSPLEASSNLRLRIHGNSTRPARKFARLGFHCKNNIFAVPIKSLSSDGGLVSCVNIVVSRQYPLLFMEKQSDGVCVFRNPRCEERVAKRFEQDIHKKREKIMYQVQVEIDNEEIQVQGCKRKRIESLSVQRIQNLFDGKELYDAINQATDPCSVQEALSNEQKRMFDDYKQSLHDNKVSIMRRKYEEAWQKLCEEETLERNVIPVLKVKLVDRMRQEQNKTAGTALLTVWRPTEQIITTLAEGKRLKIYNLHASRYSKGSYDIQLSANRSTIYKALPFEANYQHIAQPRKIYSFAEISKGLKPGVEVDIVAVVISHSSQSNLTLVYLADPDLNFVRLKVWGGLKEQALEDILKERTFVAASNLLSQPDRLSGIPSLKYYELSVLTTNPSNKMLRNNLRELKKTVQDPASFFTKAKSKFDELCGARSKLSTPRGTSLAPSRDALNEKRTHETPLQCYSKVPLSASSIRQEKSVSLNSCTPSPSTSVTCGKREKLQQSRKRLLQLKRRKLELIPKPPPLSPLPNALPDSVRKEFRVPRRIITQSKENDANMKD